MCPGRPQDATECVQTVAHHLVPTDEAAQPAACQPEAYQSAPVSGAAGCAELARTRSCPARGGGLKLRERNQRALVNVAAINATAAARTSRRHKVLQYAGAKRAAHFSGGNKLPQSIIPIALAALLSTITVQPAGNGHLSLEFNEAADDMQCPSPCGNITCNASIWTGALAPEPWSNAGEICEDEDQIQRSTESLLLNPNVVALLVRTAFILLEFGSRPLKNAKKMLSCGLICYWLFQYRFGSDGSILANRSAVCPHRAHRACAICARLLVAWIAIWMATGAWCNESWCDDDGATR